MRRITQSGQIQKAIEELNINNQFDTNQLQFEIFSYEKGELMVSPLKPLTYFMFIISGNVRIYQLKEDSTIHVVVNLYPGHILGYHEFCFNSDEYTLYAEALTPVKCLILPFRQTAKNLKTNSSFLMYLLKNVILTELPHSENLNTQMSLTDQVIFYIQNICENNTLTSVNNAVDALHCSRRSLQRALKQMCDDQILVHEKRGLYRLI